MPSVRRRNGRSALCGLQSVLIAERIRAAEPRRGALLLHKVSPNSSWASCRSAAPRPLGRSEIVVPSRELADSLVHPRRHRRQLPARLPRLPGLWQAAHASGAVFLVDLRVNKRRTRWVTRAKQTTPEWRDTVDLILKGLTIRQAIDADYRYVGIDTTRLDVHETVRRIKHEIPQRSMPIDEAGCALICRQCALHWWA
jgi:hypothetical protein